MVHRAVIVAAAIAVGAGIAGFTASQGRGEPYASMDVRRTMVLYAHNRDGSDDGSLVIRELLKTNHVTLNGQLFNGSLSVLVRPGTCDRRGIGRGIRAFYSSEVAVSFDRLERATFAVEAAGDDALPEACAEHRGGANLRTDTKAGVPYGRARRTRSAIIISRPDLHVRLTPASHGRKTRLQAQLIGVGNADGHFRLRKGSCAIVGNGTELPFAVPGGNDGGPIVLGQIVGLAFSSFAAGAWVAETDEDYYSPAQTLCVSL
jgi:hypothetical protein